jgi:hypothetical protein
MALSTVKSLIEELVERLVQLPDKEARDTFIGIARFS